MNLEAKLTNFTSSERSNCLQCDHSPQFLIPIFKKYLTWQSGFDGPHLHGERMPFEPVSYPYSHTK
jgi:hypothetical protein